LSSISDPDYSHVVPTIGEIPDFSQVADKLIDFWHISEHRFQFPGTNNSEHAVFVMDILRALPFSENLRIMKEKQVESSEYKGTLDITICAVSYSMLPILVIHFSSQTEFEHSRAQLYAQLKACHDLAKDEEQFFGPIYGVLTSADRWLLSRYDGIHWAETPIMFVNSSSDKAALKVLLGYLHRVLEHQSKLTEHISNSFKEHIVCDFE
jgi:hypothetical protein